MNMELALRLETAISTQDYAKCKVKMSGRPYQTSNMRQIAKSVVMSQFPTLLPEKTKINIKFKKWMTS